MGILVRINGVDVPPGKRETIDLPVAKLYTHTMLAMPLHVVNGKHSGPRLFVSGAIHGDELNGVEIIRRLLKLPILSRLRGALIAIPIVNVHGFLDRRSAHRRGRVLARRGGRGGRRPPRPRGQPTRGRRVR